MEKELKTAAMSHHVTQSQIYLANIDKPSVGCNGTNQLWYDRTDFANPGVDGRGHIGGAEKATNVSKIDQTRSGPSTVVEAGQLPAGRLSAGIVHDAEVKLLPYDRSFAAAPSLGLATQILSRSVGKSQRE